MAYKKLGVLSVAIHSESQVSERQDKQNNPVGSASNQVGTLGAALA